MLSPKTHETSIFPSKAGISLGEFIRLHYDDPRQWRKEFRSIKEAKEQKQLRNRKDYFRTRMQLLLEKRGLGDNPSDSMLAQTMQQDIGKDLKCEPADAEIYINPENKFALRPGYTHEQLTAEEVV